jgi:hypothetical protein
MIEVNTRAEADALVADSEGRKRTFIEVGGPTFRIWFEGDVMPEYIATVPDPVTLIVSEFEDGLDDWVEQIARSRGYGGKYVSGTASIARYATSKVPAWKNEALAFQNWVDDVWTAAQAIIVAVQQAQRQPPASLEALKAELPQPPF